MDGTEATIARSSNVDCHPIDGPIPGAGGRVHLVGGLGSGLRAAAEVLLGLDARVTGSDRSAVDVTLPEGYRIDCTHRKENVPDDATLVLRSDAIAESNVELCHARSLDIPVLSYFDWLGQVSRQRSTTAVAGTHGKSTTTAMLGRILESARRDPLVVCGAAPPGRFSGGRAGRGDLVVEACEYQQNFLKLRPTTGAILGIEDDHFDCYPTRDLLVEAFERFARSVPATGRLLLRHTCPICRRITGLVDTRVETFALARSADWSGRQHRDSYEVEISRHGRPFCTARLRVPGRHHALAAVAAAALAHDRGVSAEEIARGLESYEGLARRLQRREESVDGIEIIDDYAHHPTAVAVAIDTVRSMYPTRRICCVFQPHRRLRTERLMEKLAESMARADLPVVADIYLAREAEEPETTSRVADRLAWEVSRRMGGGPVHRCAGDEDARSLVRARLRPGDVLLLLGAGDIHRFFR